MTLEALMREAAAAFGAGDATRAEPIFRQIVDLNPRDAQAWHALALITCSSGRASEAFDCALRAQKLDPRNHVFLNMVGVSCVESGREEEALRWFRRALKEKPADASTHYNLAKAFAKLRQYEAAEKAYSSALRIDPSMADAANNLAHLYLRAGRYDDAQRMLERAGILLPDDETVAINSAAVLHAQRGPGAAIGYLETFLGRNPGAARVHYELSMRLLADGRFGEGWREYAWRYRIPGSEPPPGLAHALREDLSGQTILVMHVQGLGDQLFFLRFVPWSVAAARGSSSRVRPSCSPCSPGQRTWTGSSGWIPPSCTSFPMFLWRRWPTSRGCWKATSRLRRFASRFPRSALRHGASASRRLARRLTWG
jgi:Tfp pilus assembly protein PilF